jgi:BASS family bile acid:Na+ symporter
MGATVADLTSVWRRPGLLLRSLLAMYVLVPLAALLLVKTWPLAPGVKAALLMLAVSAGAPLLPRKLQRFGSDAYVFSLVVTSSLLAIVVVPAWITLLAWHFGVSTELAAADMATVLGKAFLLPLALGMLLRQEKMKRRKSSVSVKRQWPQETPAALSELHRDDGDHGDDWCVSM